MKPDEISLTLPRRRPFYRVAHLVLGGLAVRLDLTFETLEDLQVALAGLLERPDSDGDVTVTLRVEEGALVAIIGPFDGARLSTDLASDRAESISLRLMLETVVDRVDVDERDGGAWIELTKRVQAGPRS